ncbi:MAG TPA: amino acid adenylation domain-containing protein [Thermoanaerobaculia bacterium]|nr:amino acid adenylation domain-containing protein [Thermoanaerobaculia bacterium]
MIGFFVNTLALRGDLSGEPGFQDLLQREREVSLGAYTHQDLPFERLVEDLRVERDMSRNPIYQVLFAFQNVPPSAMAAHGLSLQRYEVLEVTSREDLELDMRETPDGLAGWFGYDAALFDRTTVLRTALHFENLLDGIIRYPDRQVADLPLLAEGEIQALLADWNDTSVVEPGTDTWPGLFAAQAARSPEAMAAVDAGGALTYSELNARANALAWHLEGLGVGPGTVVALLDRRGLDLLTAIAAVLKAGGAYLPLDPEHPPVRHVEILRQSGAPLVLAGRDLLPDLLASLDSGAARILDLGELLAAGGRADDPPLVSGPADLVYAIFTSGSTGLPKGAMIEQRGMVNHLRAKIEALGLHAGDTVAQTASQCFDISVWQFLAPLVVGGRVRIYGDEVAHDPSRLLARSEEDAVTILETVPSLLRLMLEEAERRGAGRPRLAALRWLIPTGEALPPELCGQWLAAYPHAPLLNAYGPTECSDDVTHHPIAQPLGEGTPRVPIGRPVRSTALYVADPDLRLLPIGVAGELLVGGWGVGRGYVSSPERTAGVFVPDPFGGLPGARLYRTGDRARRLADGTLDFLGRIDHQVKVRGFRIELGEIEAVLGQHPGVRQSAVLAQEAGAADRALVAYVVSDLDPETAERELRDGLKARLPEYMVPAAFVLLDAMPLTPNGKIDRRALLASGGVAFEAREGYVAPRNPVEESLAAIWAQILKVERVGVYDNFFELGGQSLLATQVVSRIREAFEVDLPVRALFQKPDVAGLSEAIETALLRGRGMPEAPPMIRIPRDGRLPPSFGQERFWFIDQFQPGLTAYNIFGAVRMRGPLDLGILERCFDELLLRHEVLRTTFAESDGRPVQVIHPPYRMKVPLIDLSALPEGVRFDLAKSLDDQEAQQPFDLAAGPLIRAQLTRVGPGDHLLAVTAHHIVYDVWSRELLIRELGALYEAFWHGRPSPLPELPVQYADFAAWQRQWLQGEVLATQLAYWKRQLAGVTSGTELLGDRPRPLVQRFRGARVTASISTELTAALKELSKKQGVTLFMTLLAGFQAFLYRYTHEEDVVIGSPIANRNRAETEGLIGFFVNTQVLRADLSGRPTFRQLVGRAREVALSAYAHQDLSFEQLVTELRASRDTSRQPLFQILFNFLTNYKPIEMELPPGLLLTPEPNHSGAVQFDLVFSIYEADGALHFSADYSTDLYERSTMAGLVGHYADLLAAAAAVPDAVFSELPFGSDEEWRQVLVDWNDTAAAVPWDSSVQTLFEGWAERTPEAVAVVCEDRQETYAGLNRRANALARRLKGLGVGPDQVVGLVADRGIDFLAAILGIFKAGGAYLPLDGRHPAERLRQVVRQSGTRLVLAASAFAAGLSEDLGSRLEEEAVRLRSLEDLLEPAGREENPPALAQPDSLAYVIYTSGSTGIPKGAMIANRGMLNHLFVKIGGLGLSAGDSVAQTASHTFDISVWQFLAALLVGGRVHVFKDGIAHDPPRLLAEVARQGVTVLETVPSLMRLMLSEPEGALDLPHLRWMIPTGEALPLDLCRRWLAAHPQVPLVNAYGPTECSDDVTHHVLRTPPPPDLMHVPIGRPVANTRLYVVSPDLLPVPRGVVGELYVGGAGVGRGYLNDPVRTAEGFIPDPFAGEPGARLYRTRDLVRLTGGADGVLEFHGRVDHQVKIRGHRIELGEIESALARHPDVADAVVTVGEVGAGEKRLVGYVVPRRAEAAAEPQLAAVKVGEWRSVFDQVYGHGAVSAQDSGINLRVWVSSYTGQPMPEEEIVECFEDSVERILALRPANLLEIGCGTGLLLNRIAPHCASYLATDLSGEVLRDVSQRAAEAGLGNVTFLERAADDFAGIPPASFDVVVLNEVVQYFPSVDYLVKVVEGALAAVRPGGVLFVGGVRSLPLLELFAASVQRFRAPGSMEVAELRGRIHGQLAGEKELAVDPRLFLDLAGRIPAIGGVWLQLKGGRHHNELTRFRYDVSLRVGGHPVDGPAPLELSWKEGEHSLDVVRRHLEELQPGALRISGIPNARVRGDLQAMELIHLDGGPATVAELGRALAAAGAGGVDPADLGDLGTELGYQVFVSWAAAGEAGLIDVVFTRRGVDPLPAAAASEPLAEPAADPSWSRYGNDPLRRDAADGLIPRLRAFLGERLPAYMVPDAMVVLDALPLTPNGKVDRRSLPAPDVGRSELVGGYVPPGSPVEETLAGIWSQLLGVDRVGIHDNFFDLGGHSLLTTQLVSRLRGAFQIEVALPTFFEDPTVAGLAQVVELARWAEQVAQEETAVAVTAGGGDYEEGEI